MIFILFFYFFLSVSEFFLCRKLKTKTLDVNLLLITRVEVEFIAEQQIIIFLQSFDI